MCSMFYICNVEGRLKGAKRGEKKRRLKGRSRFGKKKEKGKRKKGVLNM